MSRKSSRSSNKSSQSNNIAIEEYSTGRIKRRFTDKDLKLIRPKTHAQEEVFLAWNQDKSLILSGSAGAGKTMIGLYLALRESLKEGSDYDKVIIVRSPTPTKEVGHLPGELTDKQAVYELPYMSLCNELFNYSNSYENLKKGGYIDFCLTSFIRGATWNNAIVIFDEAASATLHEIDTVVTRLGHKSKIIICGDIRQSDLAKGKSCASCSSAKQGGMTDLLKIAGRVNSFEVINFLPADIVRSGIVREWLEARESEGV